MSNLPYHQQQLEFMSELARNRPEWLNPFFRYLQYLDHPYFFLVLIPIIWIGFSYQWGLRIFYWFTFSNIVNSFAKQAVGWSRPSIDLPELGLLHPTSPGFPSGGAQTSIFLGGLLIYYWRTRAAWIIGSIYILLISFSRLYLGVHYPIDVLGGWAIGGLLLALFIIAKDPLEKWLAKRGSLFCLILTWVVALMIMLLSPQKEAYYVMGSITYIMGSVMGVGLGTYFSLKHHLFLPHPKSLNEGIGRSFIGIAVLFLIVLLWPNKESFSLSFTAGILMSLAVSPVCKWFMRPRWP